MSGNQPWKPHQAKVATKTPERQVEQGGAVAAVLGGEVADVVADPADAGADDVGDAQPGTGQQPAPARAVGFDGGQLPGPRGACGSAAVPCGWADLDAAGPEPRPGELPDLPLEFPLGAEEVRVAIPATVPDAGPKTPDFRASAGIMLPAGHAKRPSRSRRRR